jgi:hypothetical protein
MLEGMSEAKELDPIMRLAAADVAAMLEGRKLPAVDLPPLDGLPTDADVLVVIDQRRLPPWRDVWRLHRVWTVREMRQVIARVGAAVTSADLCDAQWFMDRESEGYYELARRFGNARAHRSVLALRFPEGSTALSAAKYLLCCDGLFETENFRLGCGACGVKPRDGPEGAVAAQFGDLDVTVAPERLVVSRGFAVPPAGAGIPADLAKLGLGGDDAIWVHCRAVPFGELLPFTGLEALTVRVGFDGGVTLRAEGRFETGEAARQAKIVIEQLKTVRLEAVALREVPVDAVSPLQRFLASVTVTVDGSTVTAQWTGPGATPESLLAGVVDLAALYAEEED